MPFTEVPLYTKTSWYPAVEHALTTCGKWNFETIILLYVKACLAQFARSQSSLHPSAHYGCSSATRERVQNAKFGFSARLLNPVVCHATPPWLSLGAPFSLQCLFSQTDLTTCRQCVYAYRCMYLCMYTCLSFWVCVCVCMNVCFAERNPIQL